MPNRGARDSRPTIGCSVDAQRGLAVRAAQRIRKSECAVERKHIPRPHKNILRTTREDASPKAKTFVRYTVRVSQASAATLLVQYAGALPMQNSSQTAP
jgi:microcompartment protein CcmL/EutN